MPLGGWRDKTCSQQPMLEEIGDPFGIFDIGLAARHSFDMLSIDQQKLELIF